MPPRSRQPRSTGPSIAERHAEWLALLRPDGPFLTLPVLTDVFAQGLPTVNTDTRARARQAWTELGAQPDLLGPAWHDLVLTELLGYRPEMFQPPSARAGWSVRPDSVLYGPDRDGGSTQRLHVYRRDNGTDLINSMRGEPALTERVAQVCRDSGCPLALLTNGQLWVLVHAQPGEPTSVAVFDADLWPEEPVLLEAFVALLDARRVLPPATDAHGEPTTSLAALFTRSTNDRATITSTLGGQVRAAVELFVGELARLDREAGGALLDSVAERDIYRAALTVLMRLVFLLYAEEQRLLPVTDEVYAQGYAVTTLFDQLSAERDLHGDEITDLRTAAWPRLLALFGAVHSGSEHPDLRIPAYGGSLFDPAPFAWLANAGITDRVIHEILAALLMLKHRGRAPQRLSYQGLDVEQIGHVYEGLLEFSCLKVSEPYVGLVGKLEPELPLAELEAAAARPREKFTAWLRETCAETPARLAKALDAKPDNDTLGALHAACDNDAALAARIAPFLGLLRTDLRGMPTVYPAGSVLFTQVGDRRATGTHYTPRELAVEIVEHTLAPLCHRPGPAEGADPDDWQVKPANELLALKVCDPAMGSGAFLVSACRYLALRLVRAWERDGVPDEVRVVLNGGADREGLLLAARRMVATRCVYGVDRDDMAVELAKLALWLVTLAKDKPFGFLDHALRRGDSLIGLCSAEQLTAFHLDPARGREINNRLSGAIDERIDAVLGQVTELRQRIERTVVQDIRQAAEKADLLRQAEQLTERLRLTADAVVGAALSTAGADAGSYDDRLTSVADELMDTLAGSAEDSPAERAIRETITTWLRGTRPNAIRPFHWPLEFPEVMTKGGFNAVVGNPPFIGGKRVSGAVGHDVREYLKQRLANDKPGNADLCSYFLLRDVDIAFGGRVGIIATNTIAQGDTREVGLDQIRASGRTIYRATKSRSWPGTAAVYVSLLWVGATGEHETINLDGRPVRAISPSLDPESRTTGNPHRLVANDRQSHIGSLILGTGFIIDPEQVKQLTAKDSRNRDVLFPYLNGHDLNTEPSCGATRWVINFHDWEIERARTYVDCFRIVETEVKPFRDQNPRKIYRERWWQFGEKQRGMLAAIAGLDRVLVIALVSKTGLPVWVPTSQVFSHMLGVFAVDRDADLTLLSSNIHFAWWTIKGESSLKSDPRYTPSDGFETFAQPGLTLRMDEVGRELGEFRRGVMLRRQLGLTKLYNRVHNPDDVDVEIRRLREIHVEVDNATAEAYGWTDLDLGHGFHLTRQGTRFTIDPTVQVEILDRLLELNHERYAEEVASGRHARKGNASRNGTTKRSKHASAPDAASEARDDFPTLF